MTDRPQRPAPLSVRLTDEERARLERDAAGTSLGSYIRAKLFEGTSSVPIRTRGKAPVRDHVALSAVLGKLGQSRIAANINQLAKLANMGALDVTPEIAADFQEALEHIADMRRLLIAGLGLGAGEP